MYEAASHRFQTKRKVFLQRISLCCKSCLHFDFENYTNDDLDVEVADTSSEEKLFDEEIDQTEQIFDFITVLSFVSLYSGSSIESLYSVQVTGKGVANEDISDHYGHFVAKVRDTFKVLPETGSFKKCQGQTVLCASY